VIEFMQLFVQRNKMRRLPPRQDESFLARPEERNIAFMRIS
jgi:hypothetical protein